MVFLYKTDYICAAMCSYQCVRVCLLSVYNANFPVTKYLYNINVSFSVAMYVLRPLLESTDV